MPGKEVTLYAFEMNGYFNENPVSIPLEFFRYIENKDFALRWAPNIERGAKTTQGVQYKNIYSFAQLNSAEYSSYIIFTGALVEMNAEDIQLINLEGEKLKVKIDDDKGQEKSWRIAISPKHNLLVIAGGAVNIKLSSYFNMQIPGFYQANPSFENKFDDIQVSAIPIEDDPEGYFRKLPTLGSAEFKLDARALAKDYGLFNSSIIGSTINGNEPDNLVIKVSITSSKRGHKLPTMLVEHLADFMSQVQPKEILNSSVREMKDGKKMKSKRIVDALRTETIKYEDDNDLENKVNDFLFKVIELEK